MVGSVHVRASRELDRQTRHGLVSRGGPASNAVCVRVCVFINTMCVFLHSISYTNCDCVCIVHDFQPMLEYWFKDVKLEKLVEEHGTATTLITVLTDKLLVLCKSFAVHEGWKVYTEYKPLIAATKRLHDGRRRPKTTLEELSSTNGSSSKDDHPPPPPEQAPEDNPVLQAQVSIGLYCRGQALDGPTERYLEQHV